MEVSSISGNTADWITCKSSHYKSAINTGHVQWTLIGMGAEAIRQGPPAQEARGRGQLALWASKSRWSSSWAGLLALKAWSLGIKIEKRLWFGPVKTWGALTGVAQWLGVILQGVTGLIPNWDTCLGGSFSPPFGLVWEAADRCFSRQCFLPSFSPSLPLSLKINK